MVRINTVFRILVGKSEDNRTIERPGVGESTGVLISLYPDQEGKKLMFLLEWREFSSAPCLAGALLEDHWAQTALRLIEMVGYTGVLISS